MSKFQIHATTAAILALLVIGILTYPPAIFYFGIAAMIGASVFCMYYAIFTLIASFMGHDND